MNHKNVPALVYASQCERSINSIIIQTGYSAQYKISRSYTLLLNLQARCLSVGAHT